MNIHDLIDRLHSGCQMQHVPDGLENMEVNVKSTDATMRDAAIILQAIFDPENQPSQFGTVLL